jgi:glycosyltransferase involved in cell wall biosynthesis
MVEFSVVIPVYASEKILPELYRRLIAALEPLNSQFEIILVNDCGPDNSLEVIRKLHMQDSRVKFISLARNFGQQMAITAGLDHANGRAVIVMDDDLQDPPEILPTLIKKWKEGYKVVYAIRTKRKEWIIKRFFYVTFYRLLKKISTITIPLNAGEFCLMDNAIVSLLREMPERNRYLPGLRTWVGFQQIGVEFEREARGSGKSGYSFFKLLRYAADGLFSFSYLPLQVAYILGLIFSIFSLVFAIYISIRKILLGIQVPGWTALMVAVLLLGGIQLIILGFTGEYIGRIFDETKRRPKYIVAERGGVESNH